MTEYIEQIINGNSPLIFAAAEISSHENSLFTSFTTSFLTILVCEIGDKTFFLAMILAMKYNKLIVFIGSWGALLIMTVLSALFGKVAFSLIPKFYTNLIVALLFFYFGAKLIYEAYQSKNHTGQNEQLKQVQNEIKAMQLNIIRKSLKSQSQQIEMSDLNSKLNPTQNKSKLVISHRIILTQCFVMTFLAEWGDRSQIATIALAASYNLIMVNVGAIFGHFVCTAMAVQLGEYISTKVSEKHVQIAGGFVFILSGFVTLYMMIEESQQAI